MALLRTIFWFVVFLGATFVFTVLFEHGPFDFRENAKKEYASLARLVGTDVKNRGDQSDKLPR